MLIGLDTGEEEEEEEGEGEESHSKVGTLLGPTKKEKLSLSYKLLLLAPCPDLADPISIIFHLLKFKLFWPGNQFL